MKRSKFIAIVLAALLIAAAGLAACAKAPADAAGPAGTETTTIRVGASPTPHAEILKQAKELLAEQGYTLEILEMEDTIIPNTSLAEGSIDANFFQHTPYLDDFNAETDSGLVSVGFVHYEPFGIYAGKTDSLQALTEGASVAVPNSTTNEARALLLLQQAGLIKLAEGAGIRATIKDIVENPLNLKLEEVAGEQVPRTLKDVDIAVINGNYAIGAGLKIADALAVEADTSIAAQTYANILVTTAEKAKDPGILALYKALKSDAITEFIIDTYGGAVVPIDQQ